MKIKYKIIIICVIVTASFFSIPPTLTNICNTLGIYDDTCPRIGGIQTPFGGQLQIWDTTPPRPQCITNMLPNGTCAEHAFTSNINYGLSEKDCGQFYTVPSDDRHFFETYPVLILKQNSIGCAKLTYTVNYMYNDNRSGSTWPQMVLANETFHIGKYIYTSYGNSFGTSSRDTTYLFETASFPDIIDLSKYPVGSKFYITYVIKPLPNATGFYDYAIDEVPCVTYPLAVGFSAEQVNSSDFSKDMVGMHNHSCFNGPYLISSVQVSGMDFKQIQFK